MTPGFLSGGYKSNGEKAKLNFKTNELVGLEFYDGDSTSNMTETAHPI